MEPDPRLQAFLDPSPEVFHTVEHQHDLWLEDPHDVPEIHARAREVFSRLLDQATGETQLSAGRILLLLGEAGSGKTHLMRSFRNQVHSEGIGYFGYLQMTTSARDYGRYVLQKLVDSLEQPYAHRQIEYSGLKRLSNALAARSSFNLAKAIEDGGQTLDDLALKVHEASESILRREEFRDLEPNVLRALLYLQDDTVSVRRQVAAYLRCEPLSPFEQKHLAAVAPRHHDEDPLRIVAALGKIMGTCHRAALVLCVDQFEDIANLDQEQARFPRAMSTLTSLADEVPSSIVVISCLREFYEKMRKYLFHSTLHRIERGPKPITLDPSCSQAEVQRLVTARLRYLYEVHDAPFDEKDPAYPFPPEFLDPLAGMSARNVLEECYRYRERMRGGEIWSWTEGRRSQGDGMLRLSQSWNDYAAAWARAAPEDEADLGELLTWAVTACAEDLGTPGMVAARMRAEGRIEVDYARGWSLEGKRPAGLLLGLCNKGAQGSGLARQLQILESAAAGRVPVAVRATEFPSSTRTQIAILLGGFVSRGGRKLVVEDTEWRRMAAFRAFREEHGTEPRFAQWLRTERPLAQLPSLQKLLHLDELHRPAAPEPAVQEAPAAAPAALKSVARAPAAQKPPAPGPAAPEAARTILLGRSLGRVPRPVSLQVQDLTRHMAVLGSTGSGKTTAALGVIEALLLQGVPALVLDRKGDLCGYAQPEAWEAPLEGAELEARRRRLRGRIDVALYTPGHPAGRPLAISAIPRGLAEMDPHERELAAGIATAALARMMGYTATQAAQRCVAILRKAIELFGKLAAEQELSLNSLIGFIDDRDPLLLAEIGRLEDKNMSKLVQDLDALRLNKGALLRSEGEPLDVDALLGLGRHAQRGRTRLSIVSTKFLGDAADVEFWVAQLLLELTRWMNRHPSPKGRLQAVLLLDEADLYLPATRQPATKQPLENLLKRARSAGLGLLLATQSPGDLDYKGRDNIRTWLLGLIKEGRALSKLKEVFEQAQAKLGRLAGQKPGEFHLVAEGQVQLLQTQRNLVPAVQLPDDQILALAAAGSRR